MQNMITNPSQFPEGETTVSLQGPVGNLELLTEVPHEPAKSITAVICHPHSLFGGTMHNKVVSTLARAFKDLGLRTVRFNFRGVGASEGSYDAGKGETEDLLAILHWVQQVRPNDVIWLAGFSFGSYVAARGAHLWPVAQLVCVAPPVVNFNFAELVPFPCPWLVVQGDQDEVVAPDAVFNWLASLAEPPQLIKMIGVGHFFHRRLIELRELLIAALKDRLPS